MIEFKKFLEDNGIKDDYEIGYFDFSFEPSKIIIKPDQFHGKKIMWVYLE